MFSDSVWHVYLSKDVKMEIIEPHNKLFTYEHYFNSFGEDTALDLISGYSIFEAQVLDDIYSALVLLLRALGVKALDSDSLFEFEGRPFELVTYFTQHERKLIIFIRPVGSDPDSLMEAECTLEEIGKIRSIAVYGPKKYRRTIKKLSKTIADQTASAYRALEHAFYTKCLEFHDDATKSLRSLARGFFAAEEREDLVNSIWIVVFEEESGFYSMNEESVRLALDTYKQDQDRELSPFELASWMFTSPLPREHSVSKDALARDVVGKGDYKTVKFMASAKRFWKANWKLIGTDDYSVFPVCTVRDYALTICYSSQHVEIEPILNAAKESLEKQFKENIANCSLWIKGIRKFKDRVEESPISSHVKDFVARVTAHVITNQQS
jgi:hypothetical protein